MYKIAWSTSKPETKKIFKSNAAHAKELRIFLWLKMGKCPDIITAMIETH